MSSLFCTFLLILEGNFVPLRFQSKVLLSKQTHPTKKKFWLCLIGKIRRKEKQRRKVTKRNNMFWRNIPNPLCTIPLDNSPACLVSILNYDRTSCLKMSNLPQEWTKVIETFTQCYPIDNINCIKKETFTWANFQPFVFDTLC